MRIWDVHCHLPSPRFRGSFGEQLDQLVELGHHMGIEAFGLFVRPSPGKDRELTEALERHLKHVFGFVWCDLFDVQGSIDKLNRWVADGPMLGLKLGGYSGVCSNPDFDPVFARAVELQAPIYQHTWMKVGGEPIAPGGGNLPQESQPKDLVVVAKRYPDYPFICGHTGGDWELGIRAVREQKNISVETGGSFPTVGFVEMAVRELGSDRVIYGSDVTGRSFASQLAKVHGAAVSDDVKAKIFSENLRRIMSPMLKKKGLL